MSEQEQRDIIGQITQEYSDVKGAHGLLKDKLKSSGERLYVLADRLKIGDFHQAGNLLMMNNSSWSSSLGLEKLKTLLDEYAELDQKLTELRQKLGDAGINI